MSTNTTDNVTLRKSISQVVNSALFRKIINGIIETEYQKMTANINQQIDQVISRLDALDLSTPYNSITNQHLQDSSVSTNKVVNDSITTNKLADSSVTSIKISPNNIQTIHIADSSVTLNKLADNLEITNKLADSSITTEKLVNISVTTAKLAAKSVTTAKIADGAITSRHLAIGSVTLPSLSDEITSAINNNQSSELMHLLSKISNIENYLMKLSSTYTIRDEYNNDIVFRPIN